MHIEPTENNYGMGNGLLITLSCLAVSLLLQNVQRVDEILLIFVHFFQGAAAVAALIVAYVTVRNGRIKKRNKDAS